MNVTSPFCTNNKNQTIEVLETRFPIIFEYYSMLRDTPGPGKWRGGVGIGQAWTLTADEAIISSVGDRTRISPYGVFGGLPPKALKQCGHFCDTRIRRAGEQEFKHATELFEAVSPSKWSGFRMRKHDTFETTTTGGGGYGNPIERDPELVLQDLIDDYISVESASDSYSVVIDPSTLAVNYEATRKLRGR
jgi:N-methylhydantoinase B/oxoprolinase/acetone carboxylase alpha subunit